MTTGDGGEGERRLFGGFGGKSGSYSGIGSICRLSGREMGESFCKKNEKKTMNKSFRLKSFHLQNHVLEIKFLRVTEMN